MSGQAENCWQMSSLLHWIYITIWRRRISLASKSKLHIDACELFRLHGPSQVRITRISKKIQSKNLRNYRPLTGTQIVWPARQNGMNATHFQYVLHLLDRGFEKFTGGFGEKLSQSEQKFAFMCWNKCSFRQKCHSRLSRTLKCSPLNLLANRHWNSASNRVAGPFNFTKLLPVKLVFRQ